MQERLESAFGPWAGSEVSAPPNDGE